MRILVVDDDPQLCQVVTQILADTGYETSFAQTAEEALTQAPTLKPDLFILDMEIPKMGGFVLCQRLRALEPIKDTPILVLSVRDSDYDRQAAFNFGANQYLTKPFRRSQLIKEVETLVNARKAALSKAASPASVEKGVVGAEGDSHVRGRIQIVDDDIQLCEVIMDTLKERGHEASFIQTAEEGLEKALQDPPDLFILDLEVPKMGGLVLCQKLKDNPKTKEVPVIFLTVRDSDFDRQTALSLGADQYITKPFRRSYLTKEVETLLASYKGAKGGEDIVGASIKAAPKPPAKSFLIEEEEKPVLPKPVPLPIVPPMPPAQPVPVAEVVAVPQAAPRAPSAPEKKVEAKAPAVPDNKKSGGFMGWIQSHKAISIGIASILLAGIIVGTILTLKHMNSKKEEAVQKEKKAAELTEVSVNIMQAVPAPFQDILSAVGTVAGGSEIELRFQTEGNVRSLNVREGDNVRKGQVIAQLDQTQSRIKLEKSKSEYFRYEKLYALGGVSKDRLEEAKAQYDFAQSEISKTVLVATQEGIFGDKGIEVGEFITSQKKVGTLVSLNSVLIRIGVIEKEIDKIFPGQQVTATVETYPNVEFKGKVENISPLVQGQSKTLMVEARVPNTGKLLLPGMFARSRIIIFEKDNVISVPNDALEKTQEGYRLYVVGKENKAEMRPVQVGYVSLTHTVITSGLISGEQVIIQRPQELKEGSPLKVIDVEKPVSGSPQQTGSQGASGEQSQTE